MDYGYSLEPPRRGGSNEYPQSMFLAEIRKIMYTPVNLSFTIYLRVGFKGVKIIYACFRDVMHFRINLIKFNLGSERKREEIYLDITFL